MCNSVKIKFSFNISNYINLGKQYTNKSNITCNNENISNQGCIFWSVFNNNFQNHVEFTTSTLETISIFSCII